MFKRWHRNLKLEYWKTIEGYGDYMVSSLGRVKSLNYRNTGKEKILKPRVDRYGYLQIGLNKTGKKKKFLVHRLVANTFIPNVDNKPEVNHKNEIKTDNRVKNLEWMTHYENMNYGTRNKRAAKAISKAHKGKKVICIETNQIFNSLTEACEWCGLKCMTGITMCCQGKYKSAGKHPTTKEKLHWEYVD